MTDQTSEADTRRPDGSSEPQGVLGISIGRAKSQTAEATLRVAGAYAIVIVQALEDGGPLGFVADLDYARGVIPGHSKSLICRLKTIRKQLNPENEWDHDSD